MYKLVISGFREVGGCSSRISDTIISRQNRKLKMGATRGAHVRFPACVTCPEPGSPPAYATSRRNVQGSWFMVQKRNCTGPVSKALPGKPSLSSGYQSNLFGVSLSQKVFVPSARWMRLGYVGELSKFYCRHRENTLCHTYGSLPAGPLVPLVLGHADVNTLPVVMYPWSPPKFSAFHP